MQVITKESSTLQPPPHPTQKKGYSEGISMVIFVSKINERTDEPRKVRNEGNIREKPGDNNSKTNTNKTR